MHYAHIVKDNASNTMRVQTCAEHAIGTASLAAEYLAEQGLFHTGYLSGLLHDCGKFTDEFNAYLREAALGKPVQKGCVIHTFAGVRYFLDYFHSKGNLNIEDISAEILAVCVGSHHGMIDLWDPQQNSGFEHRMSKQPEYDIRAIEAFHEECLSEGEVSELYTKACGEIIGFYKGELAGWIKKEDEGSFALGLLVRLISSALVDADRTDTAGFMRGKEKCNIDAVSWGDCLESIEKHLAGFSRDTAIQEARAAFSDLCARGADQPAGLYRLDLPTGGGKTLAALRFAVAHAKWNNMRRVFYIAPLLSILEQNAAVIRNAVNGTVQLLEHHSNVAHEEISVDELDQIEFFQDTWDVPLIITTFVQLLETLFSGKMSSVRRFHNLCNSVIIIDEVQSLPPRMLTMFNCAINFLTKSCGATVVFCSATQPAFSNAEHPMQEPIRLISEQVYDQYAPLFKRTDVIDAGLQTMQDIADMAEKVLADADSLLVICNTKKEAADFYKLIKERIDAKWFHLSAGMCIAHRKVMLSKLTEALNRKEKLICVSTQVIEAGIDVSFEAVIRISAGLDNVVQAAGRCNRHGEFSVPRPVYICRLPGEKLGSLREIKDAQNALNVLLAEYDCSPERYNNDLTSDQAVHDYYSFLYRGMARGAQDYPTKGPSLFEMLSRNIHFKPDNAPMYWLNQAFRTAGELFKVFENDSDIVIVPYGEGKELILGLLDDKAGFDLTYAADMLDQLKPFTVSVPSNKVERMKAQGAVYTLLDGAVFVLNEACYDDETGIKEGDDPCATLIL